MIKHLSETLLYIEICVSKYEITPREDGNPSKLVSSYLMIFTWLVYEGSEKYPVDLVAFVKH